LTRAPICHQQVDSGAPYSLDEHFAEQQRREITSLLTAFCAREVICRRVNVPQPRCLWRRANHGHVSARPVPDQEGRFAIVTNRWVQDAMDACRAKRRTREQADGEVVWS
jgi:hypothetical protein